MPELSYASSYLTSCLGCLVITDDVDGVAETVHRASGIEKVEASEL